MHAVNQHIVCCTNTCFHSKVEQILLVNKKWQGQLKKSKSIRRIQFDSTASHEQNAQDLQRELLRIQLSNAIKYNFDFHKELPKNWSKTLIICRIFHREHDTMVTSAT